MADVFISYKREDRRRVAAIADGLEQAGLSVWWDERIEGGAAWRQSIVENLETAKCVIVIWTERSVAAEGEFVQDEAGRAKERGVLLPVRLDEVVPPVGFGSVQALNLVQWQGDKNDPRFRDLVDLAVAFAKGEPRPAPRKRRSIQIAAAAGALIAGVALTLGLINDIAGIQESACSLPGVRGACAAQGWGGVATPAEQAAWDARAAGDCQALRAFVVRYPNGAYAEEAARRLQAVSSEDEEAWIARERRLPVTVRPSPSGATSEAAALSAAVSRSSEDAEMACRPYGQIEGSRLRRATAQPSRWNCTNIGGGVSCGFDGEAVCEIEMLEVTTREVCP